MPRPSDQDAQQRQVEADLLADGRELLERLCSSTRYRHLYPDGPNLALLFEAYQELDRLQTVGRVGPSRRRRTRSLRRILSELVRRDVLDRNRRLSYRYPLPRRGPLPQPAPDVVQRALAQVDRDALPDVEAYVQGHPVPRRAASETMVDRTHRGLDQFAAALTNLALAQPRSIIGLHPQYRMLLTSPLPVRRRHPIANLVLVKLPLQLLLLIVILFNVSYVGAYYFFNDQVLGQFVSSRISGLLDGELEMRSIHWEGRLIFDLVTGQPSHVVVEDVSVWEPFKSLESQRDGQAAHADRIEARLVLHEIIPWNRLGIPAVFEIPWILHFTRVEIADPVWFRVREYERQTPTGSVQRFVGLRDAFALYEPRSNTGRRALSFAVDQAILGTTVIDVDFSDLSGWRGATRFDNASFRLRHESTRPGDPKPPALPFRFHLSGSGPEGSALVAGIEVPLEDVVVRHFECGFGGTPLSNLGFDLSAKAAGSDMELRGALHEIFSRDIDPALEPLPYNADVSWGVRPTVELYAATSNPAGITEHVVTELGLPDAVTAQGARLTAEVHGRLSDPVYRLTAEGLTLDLLGESAWAADDVFVDLGIERQPVPDRWQRRYNDGARRRVVTFNALRGSNLDGAFSLPSMAKPVQIVLPQDDEPYLLSADLELAAINPARLLPDMPDVGATLGGVLDGRVTINELAFGNSATAPAAHPSGATSPPADPKPQAGGVDAPAQPVALAPSDSNAETGGGTELFFVDLDLDNLRLVRDRGPIQDGLPKEISADGNLKIQPDGAIDLRNLSIATDGTELRTDGGLEGNARVLKPTSLALDIRDGEAFARAFDLPKYFDELSARLKLVGPLLAPSASGGSLTVDGVGDSNVSNAAVAVRRGVLEIRTDDAHLFGGQGQVDVDLALTDRGAVSSDPKIRVYLNLTGVELEQLVGPPFSGKVDIEVDIGDGEGGSARLSEIRIHGAATADTLVLANTQYRQASLSFRLTAEELAIDRLELPIHRPVSPRHHGAATVPVGAILAEGTVTLDKNPELDVVVQARGVPLAVVGNILDVEAPVRGRLARGTELTVGGRLSRPKVEGTVALEALSVSDILLGSGRLEVTSADNKALPPLAAHRELRVHGELSTGPGRTRSTDKIQWTVDAVVALGLSKRTESSPPVAAQVDIVFDQLSIPTLLRDPAYPEDPPLVDGQLDGLSAHVLTCNAGTPMLSDCHDAGSDEDAQSLTVELGIQNAWVAGHDPKPTPKKLADNRSCSSATTLCTQRPISAAIRWPLVELDGDWVLRSGGQNPALVKLRGTFDLSSPAAETDPAPPPSSDVGDDCRAPSVLSADTGQIAGSTGGQGSAQLEGDLDLASLAPILQVYGLDEAHGRVGVKMTADGHALSPRIRGELRLPTASKPRLRFSPVPFDLEFRRLDLRIREGWLAAAGQLEILGETVNFGSVRGDHTGYAISGPCAGHFGVAGEGTIGSQLLKTVLGSALYSANGGADLRRVAARGQVTADGVDLTALDGTVVFEDHTLEVEFNEGIGPVTLDRGRFDFSRCNGAECGAEVPPGWYRLLLGGTQTASGPQPTQAIQAKVGNRGEAIAWGRAYFAPDLSGAVRTDVALRLDDVPYRSFDARGRPAYEGELTSDNLRIRGGAPLVITGDADVDRARYVKDAIEGVQILRLTDDVDIPEAPPPQIVRDLAFDLRVETTRPLKVENNLASGVEAELAVQITGSYDAPEFSGRFDVDPGGTVDIPFVTGTYEIERGRVTLIREIENAEVDVLARRKEPIYIDGQPRQIQLLLGGTVSEIKWSCITEGADTGGADLDTVRGCTEYLVLGTGDVQVSQSDVQRFGGGGLTNARKPLQVVGHLTEFDIAKPAVAAAPWWAQRFVPDMRLRLGQIGPEIEVSTPTSWFDFNFARAKVGWDYTRGYPGFQLRQSRKLTLQLEILDTTTLEFSQQNRSYLNERIIFDPLVQRSLELRFDFQIPSLR